MNNSESLFGIIAKIVFNLPIIFRGPIICETDRHIMRDMSTRAYMNIIIIILAVSISTNPKVRFDVASGCTKSNVSNIPYLLFKFLHTPACTQSTL